MKHYVIVKKVTLQAGERSFRKDQTITADDVGQENIDRYLKKGYVRLLGDDKAQRADVVKKPELPFYMTAEDFLTPEQVDTLTKPQLVEYAGRIALTGFKGNIRADDLKVLINQFIEEATEEEDDPEVDEDEEDDETNTGGAGTQNE